MMAVSTLRAALQRAPRAVFVFGGILLLLAGMTAGLVRLGWQLPAPVQLGVLHGPLMICGFLGTLISLERAVAVGRAWAYTAPASTILGCSLLLSGMTTVGISVIVVASMTLAGLFVWLLLRHRSFFLTVMAVGSACWVVGNLLWLLGWPLFQVVWWWAGFLVLTIVGERLEMGRIAGLAGMRQWACACLLYLFVMGLLVEMLLPGVAAGVSGLAMILLALWLARCDVARRTIRLPGLPQFIAVCLLSGYAWMALAGSIALVWGMLLPLAHLGFADTVDFALAGGLHYDAVLHALFLGFVFGMIFGHAPIIFPAVLRIRIAYAPRFYVHWALLQVTLAARITGDLAGSEPLRHWAGLFNVLMILAFLINTFSSIRIAPAKSARPSNPAAAPAPTAQRDGGLQLRTAAQP